MSYLYRPNFQIALNVQNMRHYVMTMIPAMQKRRRICEIQSIYCVTRNYMYNTNNTEYAKFLDE